MKEIKEFKSFFRTAGGGEGEKCHYPTRLDTYGCGCYHDCSYCYAKSLLSFRKLWDNENPAVADIQKIENAIKKLPAGFVVRLGGMTDCFQPCELEHRVTYKTIELLNKYNIHYLIVTKSHIVANDEYVNIMRKDLAHIQITTTTLNDDLALTYEKASVPSKRIEAILKLQKLGFDVAIRLSPLMPEFMDIEKLNSLGINKAIVEFLRSNSWIQKWFDIDYSKYTLKEGGYNHLPLEEKKKILSLIKIPVISVCEDVQEHYDYWKNNFNPNKDDCCNLRLDKGNTGIIDKYTKSPIHYMGNKYDLLSMIIEQFPKSEEVDTFIDLFGGSGTVSLNVNYKNIIYNELDKNLCDLLKMLKENKSDTVINHIKKRIKEFELNDEDISLRDKNADSQLLERYKEKYIKFRQFYNESKNRDIKDLFTLSFYSFCNLMRFNSKNEFNVPYGSRSYLENDSYLIYMAHKLLNKKKIQINNGDSFKLLENIKENKNYFIYIDPPYTNSLAVYNDKSNENGWCEKDDEKLFNELDRLTKLGVKWAYSNVLEIKGKNNDHIKEWAKRNNYTIIDFENKDYSSLAKGLANAREVLIINYQQRVKRFTIFDFLEG